MGLETEEIKKHSSDAIHNRNCHAYLFNLKELVTSPIVSVFPDLALLQTLNTVYDENYPYGNLYSLTIALLEDQIDDIYPALNSQQVEEFDRLLLTIYHNDNHILEDSVWINEITLLARPKQNDTAHKIETYLEDQKKLINRTTPKTAESIYSRLEALFASNFKPQHDTNIPSIKNLSYKESSERTEYRFATQAQRHEGKARVSPLFIKWLAVKAKRVPEQKIAHIYFNNLGYDRGFFDIPGSNERKLSLALHELELNPALKTLVITLPASKFLMADDDYLNTQPTLSAQTVFDDFLAIAEGKENLGASDFIISPETRSKIFGNEEKAVFEFLLHKSFKTLNIALSEKISKAQRQALWVNFIKFELPNYILNKINPESFNFSCKDAIDRGALSSIFYNLFKSFEVNKPLTQEEFERALHAAAANVKGRGMNFHRYIIWNALDSYVQAQHDELIRDHRKSWLIYWRDMNCPHQRVTQLIDIRLEQVTKQLSVVPIEQNRLKAAGIKLIDAIKNQHGMQVNGQRVLLELISRTEQLLLNKTPSTEALDSYRQVTNDLKVNYPLLHIIAGLAELFLGALLYLPSIGYSQKLMNHGWTTAKTGFFAQQKIELKELATEFVSDPSLSPIVA